MCRPECEDLRGSEEGWRKGGVSMVWRQMGRQRGTIMVGGDRGSGGRGWCARVEGWCAWKAVTRP